MGAFRKAVRNEPLEVVGHLAPVYGVATVEKIAINAAMAACQPRHLPIRLATSLTSLDALPRSAQWFLDMDPDPLIPTIPQPDLVHIVVVGSPPAKAIWCGT